MSRPSLSQRILYGEYGGIEHKNLKAYFLATVRNQICFASVLCRCFFKSSRKSHYAYFSICSICLIKSCFAIYKRFHWLICILIFSLSYICCSFCYFFYINLFWRAGYVFISLFEDVMTYFRCGLVVCWRGVLVCSYVVIMWLDSKLHCPLFTVVTCKVGSAVTTTSLCRRRLFVLSHV